MGKWGKERGARNERREEGRHIAISSLILYGKVSKAKQKGKMGIRL